MLTKTEQGGGEGFGVSWIVADVVEGREREREKEAGVVNGRKRGWRRRRRLWIDPKLGLSRGCKCSERGPP